MGDLIMGCFVQKMSKKLVLFIRCFVQKREQKTYFFLTLNNFLNLLWGALRGRSPQAKIWVLKSEALEYRVGGLINYEFLDKVFIKLSFEK